jgi:hypothetical protein
MLKKVFNFNNLNKHLITKRLVKFYSIDNKYLNEKTFKLLKDRFQSDYKDYYNKFTKIHMIGLGYKNFVIENELFILIGDCNYLVFKIPLQLKIFCRKNQIYMLSKNPGTVSEFMSTLKTIKKINFYKGKGITEFKNFKFTKLKVGKKQRFA